MKTRHKMGEVLFGEEEERLFCLYLEKTALDGGKCGMGGMQNLEEQHDAGLTVPVRGGCIANVQTVTQKGKDEQQ